MPDWPCESADTVRGSREAAVQDHVVAGVQLTKRDTFLTRAQFTQLVYGAVSPTRRGLKDADPLRLPLPALLKPQPLWTGKQVG